MRSHLTWLASVADRPVLFSDTESLWLKDGRVIRREDSLWGMRLPEPDLHWIWDIAPAPEEDDRHDLRHTVGAWLDASGLSGSA
ncbi:hypothetical protein [Azospirillum canadense]|uniref:hypothetical protein n=1 Tax=Azospirillum canadense TaxID=403962 RepID=UPI0022274F84|nr:hypothetical protein [Azospirillum canadense]MCW2236982.1 hypothetical protein [Azospirillum canadense]